MKKIIGMLALLAMMILAGCNRGKNDLVPIDRLKIDNENASRSMAVSTEKRVVGYMPSWAGIAEEINYKGLTHIIYSFAIPNADGTLKPLENEGKLISIVNLAHQNGVKVSLAVGGWSDQGAVLDSRFETLASTPQGRNNLVEGMMAMYDRYKLDGIDLDWEYPDPGTSSDNYNALLASLREELDLRNGLLSAAVMGGVTDSGQPLWGAKGITDEALAMMDMVNIMAYDANNGNHSSYDWSVNCYKYWNQTRTVASQKLNFGVPFYARPSWAAYNTIVAGDKDAPNKDYSANFGYYNGMTTIKKKTKFVMDNNAGGIMIWKISQDTHDDTSLIKAINDQLGNSVEPTLDELIVLAESSLEKLPKDKTEADLIRDRIYLEGLVANAEGAVARAVGKGAVEANIKYIERIAVSKRRITELKETGGNYPQWDKSATYNTGDRVSHNGVDYEAGWWTLGEEPGTTGQWGVWQVVKE